MGNLDKKSNKSFILSLALLALVLGYFFSGSPGLEELTIYKNCRMTDKSATEIALKFCQHFGFSCTGHPVVTYRDSTGIKITPPFYHKNVVFDSNRVTIKCRNKKVIGYGEKTEGLNSLGKDISENDGHRIFKDLLEYTGLDECSEITLDNNRNNIFLYLMDSSNNDGDYLNMGRFIINSTTGQIHDFTVEGPYWCDGRTYESKL